MNTVSPTNAPAVSPPDLHAQHLLLLASGGRLSRMVHALTELDIAGLLSGGPLTVTELADKTGTHPPSLYRLLRCAAAAGVFAETEDGAFTLTPLADGLRADHHDSVRPMVMYSNLDIVRLPYDQLLHSVRTGEPAFERVMGVPFYDHLERDRGTGRFFEQFMRGWSRQLADEELPGYRLERFSRLADLGGGDGYFLAQVLRRHPGMTGVLLDLPPVVASAGAVLAEQGVEDRVEVLPGDFFSTPIPPGCDAYLLKAVLHNWADERALALLRRVREAIGDRDARLLVIEPVIAGPNQWDYGKFLDIDMLVLFGGRERTLAEWRGLLAAGGFALLSRPERHWSMLECEPV